MNALVAGLHHDEARRLLNDALGATRAVAERQRAVLATVGVVDATFEQAVALLFLAEEREGSIVRAMLRLANDDYGRCELCGAPIEVDRLRARPDARWCAAHASGNRT